MKKKMIAAAAVMTMLSAVPAYAGWWQQDQTGWYYNFDNGAYAKNGMVEIDGKKYYFDQNGYMVTGWVKLDEKWHYFGPDGSLARGWIQDGGKWYFINDDGTMRTGWYNDGKNQYYLYTIEDTFTINGAVEGAMVTGTVTLSGVTYYFDAQGHQDNVVGSFTQDGINYRYRSGVLQWENINEDGDWIQFSTLAEMAADVEEQLIERYNDNWNSTTARQFVQDAKTLLPRLLEYDETKLDIYIQQTLEEYWGYEYEDEDEYDDYDWFDRYAWLFY